MIEIAIGIDIGTSYTKAVARIEDGTVVAVCRARSPRLTANRSVVLLVAAEWWACLKDVLCGLLTVLGSRPHIASICVSAIAPTLTVFDSTRADKAYAILYSSPGELEEGASLSLSDPQLIEHRLMMLRRAALTERFVNPCISDLVGYVNWRLTGTLTINGISLAETGIQEATTVASKFAVMDRVAPRLVAPSEQIGETTTSSAEKLGIHAGIPVCGGCPDTMNSVVWGRPKNQLPKRMLYPRDFSAFFIRFGR